MTETLHDRIRQRLKETGKSPQRASVDAGLSRDFLRTLFSRPDSSVRTDNLAKLAAALDTTPEWLMGSAGAAEPPRMHRESEAVPAPNVIPMPTSAREIPVYGLAAGSIAGQLTMSNEPIEYVPAPQALSRVRDAYALIVTGSSMEPRYYAGDYIWIHPHKPIRQGGHVVIQEARDGGIAVSIKRFEKQTEGYYVTTQYNPLATIQFLRSAVDAMHRVLTPNELAGV